jgi:TPP-dependent pyruvate/acetoin dehydrogenase alpha subunit
VMLKNSTITTEELQLMNDNIALEVEEAFTFAEASPMPSADSAYTGLYSEQPSFSSAPQSEGE